MAPTPPLMQPPLQPLPSETAAPLTPCPALPDVAPLRLPETRRERDDEEKAEREREAAWWWVPRWHGQMLQPYSIGRDELWRQMLALDASPHLRWSSRMETSHLLRLLFLCASLPADLAGVDILELIEAADAWTDSHVARHETGAAVALVRRLVRAAAVVRARPRPADRKGDKGNTAVPVYVASYAVMLAAALPSLTLHHIQWGLDEQGQGERLSLARGWSLIHAHWIAAGVPTLWRDKSMSKTARWMQAWRERHNL
jgi:hypothetical protein